VEKHGRAPYFFAYLRRSFKICISIKTLWSTKRIRCVEEKQHKPVNQQTHGEMFIKSDKYNGSVRRMGGWVWKNHKMIVYP
jgi:hypothetical protein